MKANREENIKKAISSNQEKIQKLQAINSMLEEQLSKKPKEPLVLTETERAQQSEKDKQAFAALLEQKKMTLF